MIIWKGNHNQGWVNHSQRETTKRTWIRRLENLIGVFTEFHVCCPRMLIIRAGWSKGGLTRRMWTGSHCQRWLTDTCVASVKLSLNLTILTQPDDFLLDALASLNVLCDWVSSYRGLRSSMFCYIIVVKILDSSGIQAFISCFVLYALFRWWVGIIMKSWSWLASSKLSKWRWWSSSKQLWGEAVGIGLR